MVLSNCMCVCTCVCAQVYPQFAETFVQENFQRVLISSQSTSTWTISPPARQQLAETFARALSSPVATIALDVTWSITRYIYCLFEQAGMNMWFLVGLKLKEVFFLKASLHVTFHLEFSPPSPPPPSPPSPFWSSHYYSLLLALSPHCTLQVSSFICCSLPTLWIQLYFPKQ